MYLTQYKSKQADVVKQYNKSYYEMNKQKILKKYAEKVECEFCKKIVTSNYLKQHLKTAICEKRRIIDTENQNRKVDIIMNKI